jgi:voltage-gated potassium channel
MTVFRSRAKLELEYYQKNVFKIQLTAGRVFNLLVEAALLVLQPYPFLNKVTFTTLDLYDSVPFEFKLNYLLVLLSMIRLYVTFRSHLNRTEYMNPRSNRLSKMYLCKADFQFALKCMFKDYPAELIGSAFLISIVLFSFAMRVCERELSRLPDLALNYQFEYMTNSVWMTIITMTTVGYGDLFPRTLIGRIVCILLVVWGIFVVSIMVVVLTNTFQMDQRNPYR